jgi:hypothetical protein
MPKASMEGTIPHSLSITPPADSDEDSQDLLHNSDNEDDKYHYDELEPRDFRIFRIYPGEATDSLRCEIARGDFDTWRGHYQAISYVWGDNVQRHQLEIVGEGWISLTENLMHILIGLRQLEGSGGLGHANCSDCKEWFWADQICINQEDEVERAQQISLMGEIFENASSVTTFISPEEPDDAAVKLMNKFCTFNMENPVSQTYSSTILEQHFGTLPPENDAVWDSICSLMHREWVMRVWLFQENLLNKTTHLQCGPKLISWNTLTMFGFLVKFHPTLPLGPIWTRILRGDVFGDSKESLLVHIERLAYLADTRAKMRYNECVCLFFLLRETLTLRASNPKDKIYALLGIAKERHGYVVMPDYSRTDVEVYADVARQFLSHLNNLAVLSYVHHSKSRDVSWPSWVPAWTEPDGAASSNLSYYLSQPGKSQWPQASQSTQSGWKHVTFSEDGLALIVKGIIVDTIVQVIEVPFQPNPTNNGGDNVGKFLRMVKSAMNATGSNNGKLDKEELVRLFTALIHGTWMDSVATSELVWTALEPWLRENQYLEKLSSEEREPIPCSPISADIGHVQDLKSHSPYRNEKFGLALRECAGHTLSITNNGKYCVSLGKPREGDKVAVLFGGSFCYILRPVADH